MFPFSVAILSAVPHAIPTINAHLGHFLSSFLFLRGVGLSSSLLVAPLRFFLTAARTFLHLSDPRNLSPRSNARILPHVIFPGGKIHPRADPRTAAGCGSLQPQRSNKPCERLREELCARNASHCRGRKAGERVASRFSLAPSSSPFSLMFR